MVLAQLTKYDQFPSPEKTERILLVTGEFWMETERITVINLANPDYKLDYCCLWCHVYAVLLPL